jgi:hypothetical protein
MRKRFIVALQFATAEQNTAFLNFIKNAGLAWWHWIPNFWLLIDHKGESSAVEIRDKVREIFPTQNNIVIELAAANDTWAAFGPMSMERDMFSWLQNYWSKKT